MYVLASGRSAAITEDVQLPRNAVDQLVRVSATEFRLRIVRDNLPSGVTHSSFTTSDTFKLAGFGEFFGSDYSAYNNTFNITAIAADAAEFLITFSGAGLLTNAGTLTLSNQNVFPNLIIVAQGIERTKQTDKLYPADRCTWTVAHAGRGGYLIQDAVFFNGAAASGVTLPESGYSQVRFGYVGKTGRFVEVAN